MMRKKNRLAAAFTAGLCAWLLAAAGCVRSTEPWHYRVTQEKEGFGYLILQEKDTFIYQPYMPAIGGKQPFQSAEEAREAAKHICQKLARGESPALSRKEMEKIREKRR